GHSSAQYSLNRVGSCLTSRVVERIVEKVVPVSEVFAMSQSAPKGTRRSVSLLDVAPRPLSITSLNYRRTTVPIPHDVADRVRCEFVEMRGFSPTVEQAARLFQLNAEECRDILRRLVDEGFLRHMPDGRFR